MSTISNPNRVAAGKHRGRFTFGTRPEGAVAVSGVDVLDAEVFPDVGAADTLELRQLADSSDPLLRADLLSSPRLPNEVLHKLFDDESLSVKMSAVSEGTDPDITAKASRHENDFVRAAAWGRHDLAASDRVRLSTDRSVQKLMGILSR